MNKKGKFIAIGSGIKGISHMTLESVAWIKGADLVCYCVSDPATIVWLKQNAKAEYDLYQCYADDKKRIDTYHEMVDIMCEPVRLGKTVVGVFYGHPGLFCYPTHTAISRLSQEGYEAWMLPGVSSVDCLFADAGFDPAMQGIQMLEATDMLLRNRKLLTDSHVVIWQIGSVGDIGFKFAGYDGRNFNALMDYLYRFYTPDTKVLHYTATIFPVCDSTVHWIALKDLLSDKVTGVSTLYIPPQTKAKTDAEMGVALGLLNKVKDVENGKTRVVAAPFPKPKPEEMNHYSPVPAENPIADFLNELALDTDRWSEFKDNPMQVMAGNSRLSPRDKAIIASKNSGAIRHSIKTHKPVDLPNPEATGGVLPDDFAARMSDFARQYTSRASK